MGELNDKEHTNNDWKIFFTRYHYYNESLNILLYFIKKLCKKYT